MSFDWREYLRLAENLVEISSNGLGDARLRSAISRAYYSVFCLSRDRAGLKYFSGRNVHIEVIGRYKNSSVFAEKDAGKILDELRRYRNRADYDAEGLIRRHEALRALRMAQDVCQRLGFI